MNHTAPGARILCALICVALFAPHGTAAPDGSPKSKKPAPLNVAALLPSNTLAHVEITGAPCHRIGGRLAIARILREPEVRKFLEPLEGLIAMGKEQAGGHLSQMGIELADVLALAEGSASVSFLGMGEDPNGEMMPDIAVTFDFRHAKDSGARIVEALLGMLKAELEPTPTTVKIGKRTIHVLEFDGGPPLAYCVADGVLFAGTSPRSIGGMTSRLDGAEDANLTSNANWNGVTNRIRSHDSVVYAWADVQGIIRAFADEMQGGPGMWLELTGFGAIEALGYSFGLKGAAFEDKFFAYMPNRAGFFAALEPKGATALVTDRIAPRDTVLFECGNLDLEGLLDYLVEMVSQMGGEDLRAQIARANAHLGIDIEKDLIKQLGPEFSFYAALEGQAIVPDIGLVIKVKDHQAVTAAVRKMLAHLDVPAKNFEYLGQNFAYADIGALGLDWDDMPPLKPTWTTIDGHLVITLWPQSAKNLVRGLKNGTPRLADNSDYKALLAGARETNPAAGNGARQYADLKRLVGFVMDNGVPFAQSLIPAIPDVPVEIEWADFPSTEVVTRHLFGLLGATTWTKDGLLAEYTSPTGVLPAYTVMVGALVVSWTEEASTFHHRGPRPAAPPRPIRPPQEHKDHEESEEVLPPVQVRPIPERRHAIGLGGDRQRLRAQADVATLKQAVKMFQMREGRLPHNSEWPGFLTEGSKKHRAPYIDVDGKLGKVEDPWGNPYEYKKLSARNFEIVSYGADASPGGTGRDADISTKKKTRNK